MIDLSDIHQLKKHLSSFGLSANKSFGQNFLVSSEILTQIVKAAELSPQDTVVEVGSGPGVLSQRLAPYIQQLIAVEIDEKMIEPWQQVMDEFHNAVIINQDVLDFVPPTRAYKLVANIPYYISSPILKHFLRNQRVSRPELIVLMIQKEVAQRICDTKKPTLLSWEIKVFGEPEMLCMVPPGSFYPPPKVDSAVLKIQVYNHSLLPESEIEDFFELLSIGYRQPRKTLLNNLIGSGQYFKDQCSDIITSANLDPGLRPHQLSLEQWKSLLISWKGSSGKS